MVAAAASARTNSVIAALREHAEPRLPWILSLVSELT